MSADSVRSEETTDGALLLRYRGVGGFSLAGWLAVFGWLGLIVGPTLDGWAPALSAPGFWFGVAVSLALTYAALAIQCNTATIRLDNDHLLRSIGPFPTIGGGCIVRHRAQIVDFTVERIAAPKPTGRGARRRQIGGLSDSYKVVARMREGVDTGLITVNDSAVAARISSSLNAKLDALRVRGGARS